MRVNQMWFPIPIPATAKLVWDRLTFSRLTIAYFVFTLVHFVIQLAFQVKAFTLNADAAHFINNILVQGHATNASLPFLSGNTIYMCSWVPSNLDNAACPVVWNGTDTNVIDTANSTSSVSWNVDAWSSVPVPTSSLLSVVLPALTSGSTTSPTVIATSGSSSSQLPTVTTTARASPQTVTVFVLPSSTPSVSSPLEVTNDDDSLVKREMPTILAFQEDDKTRVNVSGLSANDRAVTLDQSCLWSLNWPASELNNNRREDLVFIAFQFWLLGMSSVALLNQSIPHILASLLTHMMATSWGAFQINSTEDFRSTFNRVITNGACNGISLLPDYWQARALAEIMSLAFNVFALFISCFLTWRLIKLFGWQTFKRVGASLMINRIYKIVLVLSVLIQLSLFFTTVTVSLWIDQLINSAIGDLVSFLTLYKAASIITLVLSIPWLVTGWFGVRREIRSLMFVFLFLSILYLAGWSVMFFSTTFRWTFVTWTFFSVMAIASVILMVVSFILGLVCRYNFGKGLSRHFNGQHSLLDDDIGYYGGSDIEKVEFPSMEQPVPTYSASVDGEPGPGLAQMFTASRGPRFFNKFMQPFETRSTSLVALPLPAHVRKNSDLSTKNGGIVRSDTRSSGKSSHSQASFYSYSDRDHSRSDSQSKRWVIE